ncbi:MAG: hypothetical protein ABI758_05190 [Candidatus Woesebacteria bacterium]
MEPQDSQPPKLKDLRKETNDQSTPPSERKSARSFFKDWILKRAPSTPTNGETTSETEKIAKDKERIAAKFASITAPSSETQSAPPEKSRLKQYQETQAPKPSDDDELPSLESLLPDTLNTDATRELPDPDLTTFASAGTQPSTNQEVRYPNLAVPRAETAATPEVIPAAPAVDAIQTEVEPTTPPLEREIATVQADIQENEVYVNALPVGDEMRTRYETRLNTLRSTLQALEAQRNSTPGAQPPSPEATPTASANLRAWERKAEVRDTKVEERAKKIAERQAAAKAKKDKGAETFVTFVQNSVDTAGAVVGTLHALPEHTKAAFDRSVGYVEYRIDNIGVMIAQKRNTIADGFERNMATATGAVENIYLKVEGTLYQKRADVTQKVLDTLNLGTSLYLKGLENQREYESRQLHLSVDALLRGEVSQGALVEKTEAIAKLDERIQKLQTKLNTKAELGETSADKDFLAAQKARSEGEKRKNNGKFLSGLRKRIASFIDAK